MKKSAAISRAIEAGLPMPGAVALDFARSHGWKVITIPREDVLEITATEVPYRSTPGTSDEVAEALRGADFREPARGRERMYTGYFMRTGDRSFHLTLRKRRLNPTRRKCPRTPGLIPCRNRSGAIEVDAIGWLLIAGVGGAIYWLTRPTTPPAGLTVGGATQRAGLTVGGYDCPTSGELAGRNIPADGRYYLTSFGGGSDTQGMACGGTADGTWYYLADSWRFGCNVKVRITNPANGRAVVAQVADVGPNVCVEEASGMPVIDASPLVSQYLFDSSSSGWEDRREVLADVVDPNTPLGPSTPLQAGMNAFGWIVVLGGVAWIANELLTGKR